jgi:ABC-type multidrug transport system fused ATPase/permease subunit
MAKYVGYKRPKDTKKTIKHLLVYLGHYKWMFMLVALLVLLSAGANVTGTYLVKPVVNRFIVPGDMEGLLKAVIAMGVMYACGALCTLGYNRIMVKVSQKVIQDIRNDLFAHVQKLPLKYFDAHTHGELMSRFTNDVDTVQEAMNNSFAMIIQSFIMLFGTLIMMMVLSIRLSMIVVVFLIIMFFFIKFNSKHSKKYFNRQQEELGKINGFVQEMMAGQKVEKVFNHEQKNFEKFCEMNESFRKESTNALAFAGMMIPTIVSLSYLNYAISACVGGIFTLKGLMDLGSLSSYLIYVRQSAMPLNQFTQQVNFLLSALSGAESDDINAEDTLKANRQLFAGTRNCDNAEVKKRLAEVKAEDYHRQPERSKRQKIQKEAFGLPKLPTTTIGSFPQTKDVKVNRSAFRKGEITKQEYIEFNRNKIKECVRLQEEIGLDVLVHGEYERNDMVEYFGEALGGFLFTEKAWVQSYGTRCVKPPVIWGDVYRKKSITVEWSVYAQSLTNKIMKGMLTGPVTILNWSFPREDITIKESISQIAFANANHCKYCTYTKS